MNDSSLNEIVNTCYELRYNSSFDVLQYYIDGEWKDVPDIDVGIDKMDGDIIPLLPDPHYDVDSGNDIDRMMEVRNFYITYVISTIIIDSLKEILGWFNQDIKSRDGT